MAFFNTTYFRNWTNTEITCCMVLLISGCTDLGTESADDNHEPTGNYSYANDIQPIFNTHCVNCHGNSGGLSLQSYSALMVGGLHGAVVEIGNGSGSILVQKLSSEPPFGYQMPLGLEPLNINLLDKIIVWIDEGAKNN